jgi:hypothetical protein
MMNRYLPYLQNLLLHQYIGYGFLYKSSVIFFGNEFGTAGTPFDDVKNNFLETTDYDNYLINPKYFSPSIKSSFLQFVSRFILTKNSNDLTWLDEKLSKENKQILNDYILNKLYKEDSCVVNLRPLPRPSERVWIYENVNQKEYLNQWKFNNKITSTEFTKIRLDILKTTFISSPDKTILGIGDKENKKKFFEYIYPNIKFEEIKLGKHSIYYNEERKIYLSNYFDHRCGIGISGLKLLYEFININKV